MCNTFSFLRIERYSRKVEGNLISEAEEEEEGVLNSKLKWI